MVVNPRLIRNSQFLSRNDSGISDFVNLLLIVQASDDHAIILLLPGDLTILGASETPSLQLDC